MATKKNNEDAKTPVLNWTKIGVIVAIIIAFVGWAFRLNVKVERMDEKIVHINDRIKELEQRSLFTANMPIIDTSDPLGLIEVIKDKQKKHVKESRNDYDCFTSENLKSFKEQGTQDQIVTNLMNDCSFIDLIISIKNMDPTKRQELLNRCSKIAKPTWTEIGEMTPEGQTNDGKEAELLIADAIVSKVREMSRLSVNEIKQYCR